MNGTVTFTTIKPHIGSIAQVDKSRLCEAGVVRAIRDELEQRGVLVFPQLNLSDAEQLAFTDAFGQRLNYARPDGAEGKADDVYKISLDKGEATLMDPAFVYATWFWHMDGVVVDQPLPKATLLSARRLAPHGGQTEFASTFAAWAQLPEDCKRELADLEAIHRLFRGSPTNSRSATTACRRWSCRWSGPSRTGASRWYWAATPTRSSACRSRPVARISRG
jgi:alpha-ketoglutarate-dependent taurine dioxygenase